MGYKIEEMHQRDYDQVVGLWRSSDGIKLSEVDSKENIGRMLERNPGLSYVALDGDKIIGAVLCSQDGRLGYLTHLVVHDDYRRNGIGRSLVGRCLFALTSIGISKCALMILEDNEAALRFWKKVGESGRVELLMMSHLQIEQVV
jgi:putative acetyltransferase